MAVLYLLEQGSTLHKDGGVLTVTKNDAVLQEIHAIEVEQIIIFGNINLTTPVISYILESGTDCVFCNSYGKYHGRLISTESKFGELRLHQLETILDSPKKLSIAKALITGKLQNQRTIMMRYRREMELPQLEQTVTLLDTALQKLADCPNTGSLRESKALPAQPITALSAKYSNGIWGLLPEFAVPPPTRLTLCSASAIHCSFIISNRLSVSWGSTLF